MSLVRNGGAAAPRPPLWRADAAERLRALLPEMALLVVTATCFSIAISLDGATNLLALCVKMAVCQLIVQTVMYAFTYLSEDRRMVSLGPIIVLLASYVVSALPSFRTASVGGYDFATFMAMYLGVVEFCVTRLRVTFVFLLIELVVLIGEVAEWGPLMALHLVQDPTASRAGRASSPTLSKEQVFRAFDASCCRFCSISEGGSDPDCSHNDG